MEVLNKSDIEKNQYKPVLHSFYWGFCFRPNSFGLFSTICIYVNFVFGFVKICSSAKIKRQIGLNFTVLVFDGQKIRRKQPLLRPLKIIFFLKKKIRLFLGCLLFNFYLYTLLAFSFFINTVQISHNHRSGGQKKQVKRKIPKLQYKESENEKKKIRVIICRNTKGYLRNHSLK